MLTLSQDEKRQLTQLIMEMLDDWGVTENADKHNLLGLPSSIQPRKVRRYYQDEPFPDDLAVMERIDHLLGIADALRTSFPLNQYMAGFWLNQENARFNNLSPLGFMLEGGLQGIVAVRAHLDCAWDWNRKQEH